MGAKTVAQKLLLKPGAQLWTTHPERLKLLSHLPHEIKSVDSPAAANFLLIFADDDASIRQQLSDHGDSLPPNATLWVAYPKGNRTDINRDSLWPILAERGLRPISQIAIDEVWSALRFRPLKEGEEQFSGGKSRSS